MTPINPPAPSSRLAFWFQWTLAHLVAWIVGMSLNFLMSIIIEPLLEGFLLLFLWAVNGAVLGLGFGVNYWILFRPIRQRISPDWHKWWFLGTVIGWTVLIPIIIPLEVSEQLGYPLTGLLIGAGVGLLQWLALRPHVRRSWIWPAGHALSWLIGFAMIELVGSSLGFVLIGLFSGMLTGGLIVFLLADYFRPMPLQE